MKKLLDKLNKGTFVSFSDKFIKFVGSKAFIVLAISLFCVQSGYMAFSTKFGVPPDEFRHAKVVELFVRDGIDPFIQNQDGYYYLGQLTRDASTFYHYIASFIQRASPFGEYGTIVLLRFFGVILAAAALYVFYLLLKRMKLPPVVRGLAVMMLANTAMFIFLAASVSYDNLQVLLSVAAFYFFVGLWQKFSTREFLLFLITLNMAILTKFTFLPLAVMLAVVLIVKYARSFNVVMKSLKYSWKNEKMIFAGLLIILLMFLGVSAERYGGNYIMYGRVTPKCSQVLTNEQCQQNGLYQRNEKLKSNRKVPTLNPATFTFRWVKSMHNGIVGIVAAKSYINNIFVRYVTFILTGLAVVGLVLFRRKAPKELLVCLGIAIVYIGILWFKNYSGYLEQGRFGLALQGRYAFPVIFIIYAAIVYFSWMLVSKRKVLQTPFIVLIMLWCSVSGVASYVYYSNAKWYSPQTQAFNMKINTITRSVGSKIKHVVSL